MRGRASSVAARENARGALDLNRGFCKWVAVCRRPTAVYLGLISTLEDDKAGAGGRDALSQISNGVCSDNQWVRVELPVSPDCESSPRGYQVTAHVCRLRIPADLELPPHRQRRNAAGDPAGCRTKRIPAADFMYS
jgi:hypothetical protein